MQQIQFARKQKAKWNSPTHYSKGEPAKQPRNVCSSGQDGIIFARIDGFYALTSYSRGLEMENINVCNIPLGKQEVILISICYWNATWCLPNSHGPSENDMEHCSPLNILQKLLSEGILNNQYLKVHSSDMSSDFLWLVIDYQSLDTFWAAIDLLSLTWSTFKSKLFGHDCWSSVIGHWPSVVRQ